MTPSAKVRKLIGHPVVDGDGHMLEAEPILFEFLQTVGGNKLVESCRKVVHAGNMRWYDLTPEQRAFERVTRPPWGLRSKSMRDLATAMLPKLLHERLPDMGMDFCVVLPTLGLLYSRHIDDDTRRGASRAVNKYTAEMFRGLGDRLCPAAVIPMRTPEEAVAELEHAVGELKHKVIVIDAATPRPIPSIQAALKDTKSPQLAWRATWLDAYGLDSAFDYDPFWKRCVELKVSVCGHTGGHWGSRASISSYVHNHLGLFAAGGDALCRSLFMGGVMRRHPGLVVGFLEGGVSWAATLLADLVEHWEKRRGECLDEFDGKHVDMKALRVLFEKYGGERMMGIEKFGDGFPVLERSAGWHTELGPDEFAAIGAESKQALRSQFSDRFYFGCEADDRMIANAFDTRLTGTKLHAFFGSDIGHWDVEDLDAIVAYAHGLVHRKILDADQFRDFMFVNPALFHARANPKFFEGTAVEKDVAALLAAQPAAQPA